MLIERVIYPAKLNTSTFIQFFFGGGGRTEGLKIPHNVVVNRETSSPQTFMVFSESRQTGLDWIGCENLVDWFSSIIGLASFLLLKSGDLYTSCQQRSRNQELCFLFRVCVITCIGILKYVLELLSVKLI